MRAVRLLGATALAASLVLGTALGARATVFDEIEGRQVRPAYQDLGNDAIDRDGRDAGPPANPLPDPGAAPVAADTASGVLAGRVPLGQVQPAWRDPVAAPGQIAPGVVTHDHRPAQTIRVRTRLYMTSVIALPACDPVADIYVGDTWAFTVSHPRDTVILVQPEVPGADTNMHVIGESGTHYMFYLESAGPEAPDITDMSIDIRHPDLCLGRNGGERNWTARGAQRPAPTRPVVGPSERPSDWLREVPFDPSELDFDTHEIRIDRASDAAIAPERVFSDGRWIYLDFGARADSVRWPAAFLTVDGVDQPVNTQIVGQRGQILAVAGTGTVTLRSGQQVVCIQPRRPPPVPDRVILNSPAPPTRNNSGGP